MDIIIILKDIIMENIDFIEYLLLANVIIKY